MVTIAQTKYSSESALLLSKTLFAVECLMDANDRQIALSVLENLREDLTYARLKNGSRILDVADLRQYIYEQMGQIRTNAFVTHGLYGNDNIKETSNGNGANGRARTYSFTAIGSSAVLADGFATITDRLIMPQCCATWRG